jgi:hypothetical protein
VAALVPESLPLESVGDEPDDEPADEPAEVPELEVPELEVVVEVVEWWSEA